MKLTFTAKNEKILDGFSEYKTRLRNVLLFETLRVENSKRPQFMFLTQAQLWISREKGRD